MISFKKDDLLKAKTEAIVNTVNTVGIMGKGIALQFKERFPKNYSLYKKASENGEIKIGKMFITELERRRDHPYFIINFPTKRDWRENSRLSYINEGLDDLIEVINEYKISSISIPPLGCGNGGLDWNDVKPLMEKKLSRLSVGIEVNIYEPGINVYTNTAKEKIPQLTTSRALILSLVDNYRVLGFDISHLEIQKLAYFLQAFGQRDLKLNFKEGYYGPYATNLKYLLMHLEGSYIKGQIGIADSKPLDPLFLMEEQLPAVNNFLILSVTIEERTRLEIVSNFIRGFESPFGLELLSTVHWLYTKGLTTVDKSINGIQKWNSRKAQLMQPRQVQVALTRIQEFVDFMSKDG